MVTFLQSVNSSLLILPMGQREVDAFFVATNAQADTILQQGSNATLWDKLIKDVFSMTRQWIF